MKKILLSSLTGILILAACSKDGGSGGASIVGTWNVNSIITTSYLDNNLLGNDTATEGNLKFESNGNFTSTEENGDTTQGVYTYNSSNNNLSVISDADTINFHVTNLSQTNLHLTEDESEEFSGHTVRITADADLTRQ